VLWAELADRTLTIDFAQRISKTKLQAAKWSFTVSDEVAANIPLWIEDLLSRSYGPANLRKRAKVLVNPHAGTGGADKKWEQEARPLFEAARMPFDVVQTKYSGEAIELAQNMDIDAFDTIIACSGDGLPHEIFNGLAKRADARRALQKIALGHIPCGSGNAMSCNLYGTHRASLAALAIIKGVETPLDLVSVTQGDRRTLSFLSQSLGIVAESDLATESLRWMGEARFTYGFLVRLFEKKIYPCDLAVKVEIEQKMGVKEHYAKKRSNPSLLPAMVASNVDTAGGTDTGPAVVSGDDGLPPLRYGTVNDKLPDGWELIPHDKMGNFYCGNVSRCGRHSALVSLLTSTDGIHGSRRELLLRSLHKRRVHGPRLHRWRRLPVHVHQLAAIGRKRQVLRQSLGVVPQGLGLPYHPKESRRRLY
jgi:sphingosine kinase